MSDIKAPEEHDDKRSALMNAARDLFLKNTYSNISIRKIADKAKVNSALIAYYFGSKSGLFREMVKSYLEDNLQRLRHNMSHPDQESLEDFIRKFYRNMPPELALLMFRTVVYERSEMRTWILETLFKQIIDTADGFIESMIKHEKREANTTIVRTLFQSMLIMPVLLYPTFTEIIPERIPDDFFDELARVNAAMITEYLKLETHS